MTFRMTMMIALLAGVASVAAAEDWPGFRGPDGDGQSAETDLLTEWPKAGPELLWSADGLGKGYASVSIAGGKAYTTGMIGSDGYVFCFDAKSGKELWKTKYGPEWTKGYPGARSTPTHDGKAVYVMSGVGRLVALDADKGKVLWSVDTLQEFGGKNIKWGISESPLLHDGKVIVTPGGSKGAVVAFDAKTGKVAWKTTGIRQDSAYCTPVVVQHGKREMILTMLAKATIGIDAKTGKLLWKEGKETSYDVHACSPLYSDGKVFVSSGYGSGSMLIGLNDAGTDARVVWTDSSFDRNDRKIDCHHGGVLLWGKNHVIGTGQKYTRGWACVEFATGKVAWEERFVGKGSGLLAGDLLIGYGEKGDVGLARVSKDGLQELSKFKVNQGSGHHWAHPALADGVLYIRHGESLMAYQVGK